MKFDIAGASFSLLLFVLLIASEMPDFDFEAGNSTAIDCKSPSAKMRSGREGPHGLGLFEWNSLVSFEALEDLDLIALMLGFEKLVADLVIVISVNSVEVRPCFNLQFDGTHVSDWGNCKFYRQDGKLTRLGGSFGTARIKGSGGSSSKRSQEIPCTSSSFKASAFSEGIGRRWHCQNFVRLLAKNACFG